MKAPTDAADDPVYLFNREFFCAGVWLSSRKSCNVTALRDLQSAGCGSARARNRELNRPGTGTEQPFIRSDQAKNRRAKRGARPGAGGLYGVACIPVPRAWKSLPPGEDPGVALVSGRIGRPFNLASRYAGGRSPAIERGSHSEAAIATAGALRHSSKAL